ncbi:ABC transporter substrate-binding protein [Vallitalea sp.]|jgi:ABC-type Fe3+ transport system substrate-binding protein|uniref:ABC transporter substrate-binding protein n=1 Tax=Vallitalea sp. TaxID=1882829 RepID=UPI0025DA86C9|nr:ABC transporter substrate-binding protein [Vallitalea sp.]MCT4687522.1 ABC transporter substrate-binding protein [Vallitalea sp.]
MTKYFNVNDSLYDITERYPETIDLFESIGFEGMQDEKQRKLIGKSITLETALKMKKINLYVFTENLVDAINHNKAINDETDKVTNNNADIKIEGILPCPVRIPLMESFNKWMEGTGNKLGTKMEYELKAASMGVDWLKESLEKNEDEDVLSDIFISAGFDLFFDKKLIGKWASKGVFEDITKMKHYNKEFDNEEISLKDPNNNYSIIGVVPAVFLVNIEELDDRDMPKSWEDILKPEFENSISLPIGDFDLFNAILLNIHQKYGEEGLRKLGKCLSTGMHPSEMVKSHRKQDKPVVTIMPYFFTKMIKNEGPMRPIWPSDGAIISPIFLLSKKSKKDMLEPVVDFFASKEVGEILSHNGKFPSVNPQVDNMISMEHKYMWLGWDYIYNNDMGELIKRCESIFNENIEVK